MKPRKTKDLKAVLLKKGFRENPKQSHHQLFNLHVDGKKTSIHTYFSHGSNEYDSFLMDQIKKQLKFKTSKLCERFFDCPMSEQEYVEMLFIQGEIK